MSRFSQILFVCATIIGFVLLLMFKGTPVPAAPDPKAVTDVVLQPFLSVLWGLVGYLANAMVFGFVVILAVKVARVLFSVFIDPREFMARSRGNQS